jgi:hypothetical protein
MLALSVWSFRRSVVVVSLALCVMLVAVSSASAAGPKWRLDTLADSTAVPGGMFTYLVQLTNPGDAPAFGQSVIVVTLPAGVTGVSAGEEGVFGFTCTAGDGMSPVAGASTIRCTSNIGFVPPTGARSVPVTVAVGGGLSGVVTSSFEVSGGGAPPVTTVDPTLVTALPPDFGVDAFDGEVASDAAGDPFTQAAGHPYSATTTIDFNTVFNPALDAEFKNRGVAWPAEAVRDVVVDLPPGFAGNPTVAGQCTATDLASGDGGLGSKPLCSTDSQVGTTLVRANLGNVAVGPVPVFNMVPPPDAPARLGFAVLGTVVILDVRVRSGSDYGLTATVHGISEGLAITGSSLTLWGVPSDPSHDLERACPGQPPPAAGGPSCASGGSLGAFLRNPTSCTAAPGSPVSDGLVTGLAIDSWAHPGAVLADGSPDLSDPAWKQGSFISHLPPGYPFPPEAWGAHQLPTGCEQVPFEPQLSARPQAPVRASTPTGFAFDLSLPQNDDPGSISQGDLRKAVVTLPAGVRVSPSAADGLEGCTPAQIGLHSTAEAACPDGSKLGSLTIKTPALKDPLAGSIYLASPHENPFGSLMALYLVARGSGVTVKVAGRVDLDPVTGQITTTFDDNPQLPFSELHLEFDGGPRAALTTPSACGTYTTHAVLTSWSGKTVSSDSPFTVQQGPGGGPCAPQGFTPGFSAGTENPVAGTFSPLTLRLTRSDTDDGLGSLTSLSLPPGLLADVASVPVRCTDAQAAAAACPAGAHIGTVTVGSGAGSNPFYVSGDVYLMGAQSSGPFAGDPFGLAFVVHATAGPFDLGYVVVKAGTQIHDDGSVSSVSEPFPSILQGVPLDLRDVRVNLDRPGFTINPTSCAPMGISGNLTSLAGQSVALAQRFQVGDCASLGFRPRFSASTIGTTSKANGASLHVHLATHEGPANNGAAPRESNIAKVDVQLPLVLPARLTTLQKACTSAQFERDPAGCPAASNVGTAIAHTPILTSPLSGPAILVSHGGLAFPDLVLVLQGEGVRLNITGHTQIRKGITFSHFETVPDAPVSSFDLMLPQGPHSALTTDVPGRNLCANTRTVTVTRRVKHRVRGRTKLVFRKMTRMVPASLVMPTVITAQNGTVIRQGTRIAVTGCARASKVKQVSGRAKRT